MKSVVTLSLVAGLAASLVRALPKDWPYVHPDHIIRRDVAVIGGGSSGTYAAAKLQRMGKTVAVVEKKDVFGGHTSTYHDPQNRSITVDYGVQAYGNVEAVRQQFARFDVPLGKFAVSETGFGIPNYLDFRDAKALPRNFSYSRDLSGYRRQADKYPYLCYSTRLPDPVPSDLLLPFGQFLEKYKLQNSSYNLFYTLEGLGDLLAQTTLYVIRYLNSEYLDNLDPANGGALVTVRKNNHELYEKAQRELGADALSGSEVIDARRDESGAWLVVQTPEGRRLILADRLIITIPPLLSNMGPFQLDKTETTLFSKWRSSGWYVGIIEASGFPSGYAYQNTRPDTPWNLPELPSLYQLSPTAIPNAYLVRYGTPDGSLSDDEVKADILRTVERLRFATIKGPSKCNVTAVKFLAFSSHYPFNLHVPVEDIKQGFYNHLDDLQGHRSTWYTGAAIISHGTGALWNFTDYLVDRMYE